MLSAFAADVCVECQHRCLALSEVLMGVSSSTVQGPIKVDLNNIVTDTYRKPEHGLFHSNLLVMNWRDQP